MRLLFSIACIGSALLGAAPAAAQQPAQGQGPEPEIVVEGQRIDRRQVEDFVGALSNVPSDGQIARFDFAACPAAFGMSPAHNEAVAARMRAVGRAAGVPLAPPPCRPNVILVVTPDKRALIENLRRRFPSAFIGLTPRQIRRLARSEGPAAWHVEGVTDSDGVPLNPDPETGYYSITSTMGPSRLIPLTNPYFQRAVLIVEARAVSGMTPTQLADYAAMRTFAKIDPAQLEGSSVPSILTMLEPPPGRPIPITLTHWDLGYLRALYAVPPNRFANSQRSHMRRQMLRELQRTEPAEE